jgi:hypothetical protein
MTSSATRAWCGSRESNPDLKCGALAFCLRATSACPNFVYKFGTRNWWAWMDSNHRRPEGQRVYSAPRLPLRHIPLCRKWLRERDLNTRFVGMSHVRGLVTAPSSRKVRGFELTRMSPVHPWSTEFGGEPRTRISDQWLVPSVFEAVPAPWPVDSPYWRKAAVSIRSGKPPDRFPSDADRPIG